MNQHSDPANKNQSSAILWLEPILHDLTCGAAIFSADGRLIYANKAFLSIFGYTTIFELESEIFGLNFPPVCDENENRLNLRDLIAQHGNKKHQTHPILIHFVPKRSSTTRWISLYYNIQIPDEENQLISWIAVDLTGLYEKQMELEGKRDELQIELLNSKTDLRLMGNELLSQMEDRQKFLEIAEVTASIGTKIIAMTDLRSILQSICDQTIRSTDYDFCSISIYNEESDKLELTAFSPQTNLPYPYPSISRQKYDDYIQSYGSPNVFEDINSLSNEPELEILHYFGVRTVVVFPLKNNGELLGSLAIASIGDVRLPNHHDLHFLRNLSTETEVSLSKGLLIEKLTDSSKRMQILTKKLIEVQEEERRSLARELHDQIGQSLTSLRLNLDLITHTIQGHPESCEIVQGYIDNASEITVRLLERIREMSLDLRPTMLDDFGLVPALLAFFDRQAAQANIQVDFKHSGVDRRYHSNLETAAFRIIQEGLTNAAKHSGTQLVSVRLWADEHFLRLRVEDSGNGFDLQKAIHSGKTSGLSGMYERAASLGGSLEIETEPKHGTCITAGLSIRQEEM